MDKVYKPVPDVEALRYHGTPEKPDIKIFVSHRIDQDSETIDNPLYIPVRCGAVYDQRENVEMLGDDTGDNISEQYKSYEDLTVQYWAWKNVKSDFYGFCTCQKYFSFNEGIEKDAKKCSEQEVKGYLSANSVSEAAKRFDLGSNTINELLKKNSVITISPNSTAEAGAANVNQYLLDDIYHFDAEIMTSTLKVIQHKYPTYLPFANQYLTSQKIISAPIWIARSDIFNQFCEFQFGVLESLEKVLHLEYAGAERKRVFSILGSHLWGIFLCYLRKKTKNSIKQVNGIYCKFGKSFEPIAPAFESNNVTVVFSSSNTFAPYLGVALQSMMDTISSDYNYDIIILEKSIHDDEKKRISDVCSTYQNVSLRFVNTRSIVSNVNFYVPVKNLSEETYYTVLVPWVLKNYKKALVLDCDIIINHDLAELYNTNIDGLYLAAVKEIVYLGFLNNPILNINDSITEYTKIKLGLDNPYDYFNAGVLLLNLEMFREHYTMAGLLEMIDKNQFNIVEQDLLNSIAAEKVYFLDYAWNFMSCLTEPSNIDEKLSPSDTTIPNLKLAPAHEIELYKKAADHPYIYHYLTRMKPWKYPYLKYADIWWKVARRTVWYETFLYHISRNSTEPLIDGRTGARKVADFFFPKGSKRRELLKKIIPKGSKRWAVLKQIYYVFNPRFKRPMREDIM